MRDHHTDLFAAHVGLQTNCIRPPVLINALDRLQPLLLLLPITGLLLLWLYG